MHCINLDKKNGDGLKNLSMCVNYIYASGRLCHENIPMHMIYKSTGAYNLYKRTNDTIVKSTVSLNDNIHTNVVSNITSLVLYICNPPLFLTCITCVGVFNIIHISVCLLQYMHHEVSMRLTYYMH